MYTDPKKNRTQPDCILIEQFRYKGYQCREIREEDSTIFILRHEKEYSEMVLYSMNENYQKFIKVN